MAAAASSDGSALYIDQRGGAGGGRGPPRPEHGHTTTSYEHGKSCDLKPTRAPPNRTNRRCIVTSHTASPRLPDVSAIRRQPSKLDLSIGGAAGPALAAANQYWAGAGRPRHLSRSLVTYPCHARRRRRTGPSRPADGAEIRPTRAHAHVTRTQSGTGTAAGSGAGKRASGGHCTGNGPLCRAAPPV